MPAFEFSSNQGSNLKMRTLFTGFSLILSVSASIGLSGCSKPQALVESPSGNTLIPTRDLGESVSLLNQTRAVCGSHSGCQPAVAFMTAANAGGVGLCTAVLVASDLMLTNSHCIPEDLKQPGSSCVSRIKFAFPAQPAQGLGEEILDCDEVISASALGDPSFIAVPDYAVLRLSHASQRRPLSTGASAGIADAAELSVHRSTPISTQKPVASIDSGLCHTVMNSAVLPSYGIPNSPIILLGDCPMDSGNSGAAVIDSEGKLAAILQSTLTESRRRQFAAAVAPRPGPGMRPDFQDSRVSLPSLPQFSFATWVGCIRSAEIVDGSEPSFDSAACANLPTSHPVPDLIQAAYVHADVESVTSQIGKAVVDWDVSDVAVPKAIEWKARALSDVEAHRLAVLGGALSARDTVYLPVPKCIRPLEEWRDERRYRGSLSVGLSNWYSEPVSLPFWVTHLSLDTYLRGVVQIVASGNQRTVSANFGFSPKDVKLDRGTSVALVGAGPQGAGVSLASTELLACDLTEGQDRAAYSR